MVDPDLELRRGPGVFLFFCFPTLLFFLLRFFSLKIRWRGGGGWGGEAPRLEPPLQIYRNKGITGLDAYPVKAIGPCTTRSRGTKLYILVSKLHSGTSKTKAGALFWKSHCAICSTVHVILYHVTGSCKGPINTSRRRPIVLGIFTCSLRNILGLSYYLLVEFH